MGRVEETVTLVVCDYCNQRVSRREADHSAWLLEVVVSVGGITICEDGDFCDSDCMAKAIAQQL